MPSWLTEVLKLLGFTTPFVYAAATYGVFHWLDKKASGPAKRALTARLKSEPPNKDTLANYTLEVFDRIYGKPLWHVRVFVRSALITATVCVIVWLHRFYIDWAILDNAIRILPPSLVTNILADYVSLFFIKKLLTVAAQRPILGLIVSFLVGSLIVWITFVLRVSYFIFYPIEMSFVEFLGAFQYFLSSHGFSSFITQRSLSLPAVAVHLWLPLFALSIGLAQASGWLFKAVSWMQWFLKQGQNHPFQAVGFVASVIVFVSSVVIQYVWR